MDGVHLAKDQPADICLPAPVDTKPGDWRNYSEVFYYAPFLLYFRNTLIIVTLTILGTSISSSLVAYGFARLNGPGKNILFLIMLSSMMLPYMVWMVPMYVLFTRIGWVDTFYPLTVPAFFGNPLYIFLLRQFFMGIPRTWRCSQDRRLQLPGSTGRSCCLWSSRPWRRWRCCS